MTAISGVRRICSEIGHQASPYRTRISNRPFATFKHTVGSPPSYVVASILCKNDMQKLFNKKLQAIVIPQFLCPKICKIASSYFESNPIEEYTNAPGIGRIGISFYETIENPTMEKEYFKQARLNMQAVRDAFRSHSSPIDLLRVTLDEMWPQGANLGVHQGRKMFAGLCRSLEHGKEIIPHEDVLERDDPIEAQTPTVKSQLAANIYIQNPEAGGELELFDQALSTEEYDRLRGDSYGIKRELLPKPTLSIKPETGDLILFNSRNLHAVSTVDGKRRISISCFIGDRGENQSLKIWS